MATQAKPEPQLLESGAVLVPVSAGNGGWKMSRVELDDEDHAYWLTEVQKASRPKSISSAVLGGMLKFAGMLILLWIVVMAVWFVLLY